MNYLEKLRYLENYAYRINKQKGCPYPVSNQSVICGVVSKSQKKAAAIMQRAGATPVRSRKNGPYEWELNGERWIWFNASNPCRGYRLYKCYLDAMLDLETIQQVVWPTLAFYCCELKIIDTTKF